jgi:hypothetical protein
MTQRALGGYEFNQECVRVENAAAAIRNSLIKMIETNPGTQTHYMLTAKMAVEVANITDAINNIKDIGQNQKSMRK